MVRFVKVYSNKSDSRYINVNLINVFSIEDFGNYGEHSWLVRVITEAGTYRANLKGFKTKEEAEELLEQTIATLNN